MAEKQTGAFEALSQASDDHAAAAGQTPLIVRRSLLHPEQIEVCGLQLHPFKLGILLLLEEIEHPEVAGSGKPAKILDTARAIYIFANPLAAREAIARGLDHFDSVIFDWAQEHVSVADIPAIGAAIRDLIQRGRETLPGQHAPGEEDSDPLATSRPPMPGSAGS